MSLTPATSPGPSGNIFVNYRREDSAGHAGRLFDRLSSHFPGRMFMDIDNIEPGVDFAEAIEQAVGCCEVLIVVIGREWLNIEDAAGRRRLDNPQDFVRMEVAAALDRNIRVIPVLVEGATMPRPEDLPSDLARLTRRNAIELSDARWAFDVDRLIRTIEGVLREKAPSAPVPGPSAQGSAPAGATARPRAWVALAVFVALCLAVGIGWRLLKREASRELEIIETPETSTSPVEAETTTTEPVEPNPPPQPAYEPDTCKEGFVWREARPEDHVCVLPDIRDQTLADNQQAEARRDPAGDYGPSSCLSGYVWREAFEGDLVCVTPETRAQAKLDNSQANERRMSSEPP